MQVEPASNGHQETISPEAGHQTIEPKNEEIMSSSSSGRNVDLSLQIPPRPVVLGKSSSRKGVLRSQCSIKCSSSHGDNLRSQSFKNKVAIKDSEGSSLLVPDNKEVPESPILASIIRALSWKRCSSFPVTHAAMLSPTVSTPTEGTCAEQQNSQRMTAPPKMSRSLSVPVRNVVIVRSVSFALHKEPVQAEPVDDQCSVHMEDGDEEIPEEEAVCRICLIPLCEGGKTFKLECSCKGDLRLTHEECVVKWFSIKGNKICDVCNQEVCNLPVNLLRVQSTGQRDYRQAGNRHNFAPQSMSAWHDLVVLILISSISYFFILEQLLVDELQNQAVMLAAPFAFTLGLLGSMFAIVIAIKEYIWTYAALEFSLVALILHLFYVAFKIKAVYAVILAAILGFGIAMCINTLYLYIYTYRFRVSQRQSNSDQV